MEWSKELLEERLELAAQRITEIEKEGLSGEGAEAFDDYFRRMAAFLNLVNENRTFVEQGGLKTASLKLQTK